jgi:hypothetical protein
MQNLGAVLQLDVTDDVQSSVLHPRIGKCELYVVRNRRLRRQNKSDLQRESIQL